MADYNDLFGEPEQPLEEIAQAPSKKNRFFERTFFGRHPRLKRFILGPALAATAAVSSPAIGAGLIYTAALIVAHFQADTDRITHGRELLKSETKILDKIGTTVLDSLDKEKTHLDFIDYEKIPVNFIAAAEGAEDRTFREHSNGLEYKSLH